MKIQNRLLSSLLVFGVLACGSSNAHAGMLATAGDTFKINQTAPKLGDAINFSYTITGKVPASAELRVQIVCSQSLPVIGGYTWVAVQPADSTFIVGSTPYMGQQMGIEPNFCSAQLYTWSPKAGGRDFSSSQITFRVN